MTKLLALLLLSQVALQPDQQVSLSFTANRNGIVNNPTWSVDDPALLELVPNGVNVIARAKGVGGTAVVTLNGTSTAGKLLTDTETIVIAAPPASTITIVSGIPEPIPATTDPIPPPTSEPSLSKLVKLGSFSLQDDPVHTAGDDKLGHSAGLIAFDEEGTLWCIARSGRKFAPFRVPEDLKSPSVQSGPWQDFTGGVTFPNSDSSIRGVARHNGQWVMTVSPYYNGTNVPWILVGGKMLQGSVHQRRAAGYLTSHGGNLYSGLAGIPIAQDCSKGPVSYEWDISHEPIQCAERLYYATPHPEWYQGGVADVDEIRGLCCGENYRLFFGRRPLGTVWYGSGSTHPDMVGVTDPCSPYQGYHSEGSTAAAWLYDADWKYLGFARIDELLGLPGPCSRIQCAVQNGNRIYVTVKSAELDPRPVVHVLEFK